MTALDVKYNAETGEFVIKGKVATSPEPSKSGKSLILASTQGFVATAAGRLSLNLIK